MTELMTTPATISDGIRLLAHILQTTTIPAPYGIYHPVLADNDHDGVAVIDRIGAELERAGIDHKVHDTDHHREISIPLTSNLNYCIGYVFREAMAAAERRSSYRDNIA